MTTQPALDPFATRRAAASVYCHQDFLDQLDEWRTQPIGKRVSLLMQRLAVDSARVFFKGTRGVNQGWRRSRLGGNQGSHFYLWWAPQNAAPLEKGEGFSTAPEGTIFLRAIRHHDEHSALLPQTLNGHYMPVSVLDMRREDYGPAPWTQGQSRFASARASVRILKGFPGSGKTTALLHAADSAAGGRVLYVTYSPELAILARQYFDRFCSKEKTFQVATYDSFLRQLLNSNEPPLPERDLRARFRADLLPHARSLGLWAERFDALYDELHAHLVGAGLPVEVGRFAACSLPRASDRNYRQRRSRFIGLQPATQATDAAARLDRSDSRTLADRYFPELALAWRAARLLAESQDLSPVNPDFLEFDCIAIDECQDLTPLEAFVLVQLGDVIRRRKKNISLLAAGDEAQTVRPTDFEWGWMNDMLHHRLATPQEFKLSSNLRSPRSIAQMVNHVWDLYETIEKRDRPGGAGYAEIDDDATDQILYCAAAPGEEFSQLMTNLAAREGFALINLSDTIPAGIPETARQAILTASDAKGLDFHTACLINAGHHLDQILADPSRRFGEAEMDSIRKRLAIDKLRVALSRPAERLIWLDVQPSNKTVANTLSFLNHGRSHSQVAPIIPAALQTALEEEQLTIEERVQRCQTDARQFLSVKPDIAWSRAKQAVALLGDTGNLAAVTDPALRRQAFLTLSEVCFRMAMQNARLAPELGSLNLFQEAVRAASSARMRDLSDVINDIENVIRSSTGKVAAIGYMAQTMVRARAELEPWLMVAISGSIKVWIEELEAALPIGENASILPGFLPDFYDVVQVPDAQRRRLKLYERAIHQLIKNERYSQALDILAKLPERNLRQETECYRALGKFEKAAELAKQSGDLAVALACYREIPDFDEAFALIQQLGDHPAAGAYQWLSKLRQLAAGRPADFQKTTTQAEKKLLEEMLESALGVSAKKKPAARARAAEQRRDEVVKFLKANAGKYYCASCLAEKSKAGSPQQMYPLLRSLQNERDLRRGNRTCSVCLRWKACTALAKS
jgi:hypothetical protein